MMVLRRVALYFTLSLWVLSRVARAQNAEASPPSQRRQPVDHFRLRNGLEVVLDSDARTPFVATVLAYEAGSSRDPAGHAGLAHLVEHLTFRRSRHLREHGLIEHLERAGALHLNGTTAPDTVIYSSVVPARHFALPLWLESERMAFTLEAFSERALEVERARVRQELQRRGRSRSDFAFYLNQALYPKGHPYRHRLEELENVSATKLSDAAWFFQKYYRPDNAHLVMVGNFDRQRVVTLIQRYFGPIGNPPGNLEKLVAEERSFTRREIVSVEDSTLGGNRLVMVFPLPDPKSADAAVATLILRLLGDLDLSLRRLLVETTGVAEFVGIDAHADDLVAHVRIYAHLREGVEFANAERVLDEHWRDLRTFRDSAALERAKSTSEFELLSLLQDPLSRARTHLGWIRRFGRPFTLQDGIQRLERVTATDVRRVAEQYFNAKRRLVGRHERASDVDCARGCVSYFVEDEP